MPKMDAKVIETLAVMTRYNPFFEKARIIKLDYERDKSSVEKRIKAFLEQHGFNFDLLRSKTYCYGFFNQLGPDDKEALMKLLSEFADQPYIKMEKITPELLTKTLASDCAYFYWIDTFKIE